MYTIKLREEFIKLGQALKAAGVVENGAEAKDVIIEGVNDSKKISEKKREELYDKIIDSALSVGVGMADIEEIENLNILGATKLAMTRAVENLKIKDSQLLA